MHVGQTMLDSEHAAARDLHDAGWELDDAASRPAPARWLLVGAAADELAPLRDPLPGRTAIATADAAFRRLTSEHFCWSPRAATRWEWLLRAAAAAVQGDGPLVVLETPAPSEAPSARARRLADLARAAGTVGGVRVCALTHGAQRVVAGDRAASPSHAALWPAAWWLADLPSPVSAPDLACLASRLGADGEPRLVAVRDGRSYTARADAVPAAPVPGRVQAAPGGGPADVALRPFTPREPGPGQIAIAVSAAALNFRDALLCMGKYPGQGDRPPTLGWECAGTVTATGTGAFGFRPGDEVIALAHPALATHVVTDAALAVLRPPSLSAQEAVTLPVAYATAQYGLCELARMRDGETVLIHTATGGVGMAAIQIAQRAGARILATAGSPGKRALLRMLGVRFVGDSRSADFAAQLRAATHGGGVDIVLNTLAGPARDANWELLAPYGRFVDLTKRDILLGGAIAQAPFARNLSFHAVDLADMVTRDRPRVGAMLREIVGLVERGELSPLPFTEYPAREAAVAFQELARGGQTGKLVLTF